MTTRFCVSILISALLFAPVASAKTLEDFLSLRVSQTQAQLTASLGKPAFKISDAWHYEWPELGELDVTWDSARRLKSAELRFSKPRKTGDLIPHGLLLVLIHRKQEGDARTSDHWVGDPKTGRVWEVGGAGAVTGIALRSPWKTTQHPRTLAELLKGPSS